MSIVVASLSSQLKINIFFLKFLVLICCYTSLYSVPILIIEQEDGTYPHLQQVASNLQKIGYLLSEINCMFTWENSQTEMLFFFFVCLYICLFLMWFYTQTRLYIIFIVLLYSRTYLCAYIQSHRVSLFPN